MNDFSCPTCKIKFKPKREINTLSEWEMATSEERRASINELSVIISHAEICEKRESIHP